MKRRPLQLASLGGCLMIGAVARYLYWSARLQFAALDHVARYRESLNRGAIDDAAITELRGQQDANWIENAHWLAGGVPTPLIQTLQIETALLVLLGLIIITVGIVRQTPRNE